MSEKLIAREELLGMLSEINNQLEELENVLDSNISGIRQNWHEEHAAKIDTCENRITNIGKSMVFLPDAVGTEDYCKLNPKNMKLELGF